MLHFLLSSRALSRKMLTLQSTSKAAQQFPQQFDLALEWIQLHPILPRPVKIIVVEGLDGTGKSTLVDFLSVQRKTQKRYGIHGAMQSHRSEYDQENEHEKRQFYLLGNIALMAELQTTPQKNPICILDRSYATTLSYAAGNVVPTAQDTATQVLPPTPIHWPAYLRPDIYIVLHCEEQERLRRLSARSVLETNEEKDIAASNALRRAIDYCYRNFEDATVLDTTPLSASEVASVALEIINNQLNTNS